MAALITAGGVGATGSVAATGAKRITASGTFSGSTRVEITIVADSQRPAVIHNFTRSGSITVDSVTGQTITATVLGGGTGTSIDVSQL